MKVKTLSRTNGVITLAEGDDGSLVKKAILCITGSWMGMYGEITVTREMLQGVADRANKEAESAMNEFDYPPILTNHVRDVEVIMGYLDISQGQLTVGEHPKRKGVYCLFGPVRVDDDLAKEKVKKGKYRKLSMSFDDETFELYEVSFVAVEAARGSQVLSKGDKNNMGKKVSLTMVVKKNKEVSLALVNGVTSVNTQVKNLSAHVNDIRLKIKSSVIKGTLSSLVKEGRLTKAEFDKINIQSLAAKDAETVGMLLDSYKTRPISSDIAQFGVEGAKAPKTKELSAKEFAALKKAQESGKTSLSSGDEDEDEEDEGKDKNLSGDDTNKDGNNSSLSEEDTKDMDSVIEKCLAALDEITKTINSLKSSANDLEVEDKTEDDDTVE